MATETFDDLIREIEGLLEDHNLTTLDARLNELHPTEVVDILEREDLDDRAVMYRLLKRDEALEVFELLDASMQAELLTSLRAENVVHLFENIDPDDRASLIDELPAKVARRLMSGLSEQERALTAPMLGYAPDAIGRRMSPEYIRLRPEHTVRQALNYIKSQIDNVETIYSLMVADHGRVLRGVVSLRALIAAGDELMVSDVMEEPLVVHGNDDVEIAARTCVESNYLAVPVLDAEERIIGILTYDDAARILAEEEEEDAARAAGFEPLRQPYLTTSVFQIVRSRIVWLLVLAISATLTVKVLGMFEEDLAKVTVLALFIPLLTGTGGNTGTQAASTVTRALAMGDVRFRDIWAVLFTEVRVGLILGASLGAIAFGVGWLFFGMAIGTVLGLTILVVCTLSATVGGFMPMIGTALGLDPAVVSTPFISVVSDATGLITYFLIAKAVLGL